MNRRNFLTATAIGGATLATTGCSKKEDDKKSVNINKNKKTKIKLATSWPAHFPIMGTGVEFFANRLKEISGGQIKVKIYPKNVLVPALEVFDATSGGVIDAFHSGPYYWKGKNSAFSLFGGFPFGFTSAEMNSWMYFGGGLEIWRELYDKHNLYPLLGGNTDSQMGGWFRKKIESLDDLNGIKMRVPGLGGEVMSRLGVNPILLPAGEIYLALERGVIDATEWVGPALDIKMGFHKVAKHYYTGWHEPGSVLEMTFNKRKWNKLSSEQQAMIEMASNEMNSRMSFEFQHENAKAFENIEKEGVIIEKYPKDILDAAKKSLIDVINEQSKRNKDFAKVWASCESFLEKNRKWTNAGIGSYLQMRG